MSVNDKRNYCVPLIVSDPLNPSSSRGFFPLTGVTVCTCGRENRSSQKLLAGLKKKKRPRNKISKAKTARNSDGNSCINNLRDKKKKYVC